MLVCVDTLALQLSALPFRASPMRVQSWLRAQEIDATINAIACRCRQARRRPPAGQGSTLQPASAAVSHAVDDACWKRSGPRLASTRSTKPTQEKRKRVKRLRHHRNPLSAAATQPAELAEDWARTIFDDRTQPLTVDVGCALGGWCVESASSDPSRNFLGLELRPEAVARAQESAQKLPNCAFLQCNANVDLGRLLGDLANAGAPLERNLIQFPDPHFKKKHRKRRVCTPELAETVARSICASPMSTASVYVASDVLMWPRRCGSGLRRVPSCVGGRLRC